MPILLSQKSQSRPEKFFCCPETGGTRKIPSLLHPCFSLPKLHNLNLTELLDFGFNVVKQFSLQKISRSFLNPMNMWESTKYMETLYIFFNKIKGKILYQKYCTKNIVFFHEIYPMFIPYLRVLSHTTVLHVF